ncbi:hypothetical protein ACVNF4_06125 [Streptomyces sp. S6]
MESVDDPLTGLPHRQSRGCSSPVTDGTWFWRLDLPHYVRGRAYRMPALVGERFAAVHDAVMPVIGWSSAAPWTLPDVVLEPTPRPGPTRAEFDAALLEQSRRRPHGSWSRPRKPREPKPPDSIG